MARKTSANSQKDQCRWDCPYRIQHTVAHMKQIGNLAIVCARRKDVTLRIEQGRVMVLLDGTYAPTAFFTDWDDDDTILSIIHELNFGHCAPKNQ